MVHTSSEFGDTFKCTKCEQFWVFNEIGHQCLIVKALYPQKMNGKMRHEFLDYKLSEYLFIQKALLLSGKINQSEFDERKLNAEKQINEEHQRVPIKKWWEFWTLTR